MLLARYARCAAISVYRKPIHDDELEIIKTWQRRILCKVNTDIKACKYLINHKVLIESSKKTSWKRKLFGYHNCTPRPYE